MLRRALVLILALSLLAPAAAAAQGGDPFSPLPPPQPTPAPVPQPVDDPADGDVGRTTLYVIAGALLIAFVGVGMFISRDARRSIPKGDRPDAARLREQGPHKHERRAKSKARAKGRQARAARKVTKRRSR
jgi:hypothetical protein